MTLAQAAPIANSLYHEWGLLAAIFGVFVVILGGLWWLPQMEMGPTLAAALKIRSKLAGVFQATVVRESLRLFELVDGHLSYSLSQSENAVAQPSAFDKLAAGLRQIDLAEPDRATYRDVIEHALSGIIISHVRKLLELANAEEAGALHRLRNPTGITFGFEGITEQQLLTIAHRAVKANRKEKRLSQHRNWAFYSFLVAGIAAFFSTPFYFFDTKWAFVGCVSTLGLMATAGVSGLINLGLFVACKQWIEQTAGENARVQLLVDTNGEGNRDDV